MTSFHRCLYSGLDAYKKDYQEFLDQFQGGIDIEY